MLKGTAASILTSVRHFEPMSSMTARQKSEVSMTSEGINSAILGTGISVCRVTRNESYTLTLTVAQIRSSANQWKWWHKISYWYETTHDTEEASWIYELIQSDSIPFHSIPSRLSLYLRKTKPVTVVAASATAVIKRNTRNRENHGESAVKTPAINWTIHDHTRTGFLP